MAPSLFPARNIPRFAIASGRSMSTLVSAACFTLSVLSYTSDSRLELVYCSAHDSYTSSPVARASPYSKLTAQYSEGDSASTVLGSRLRNRAGQPQNHPGTTRGAPPQRACGDISGYPRRHHRSR